VLDRVSRAAYEPALRRLGEQIRRHDGRFRLSLGVSGLLLEQLRNAAPAVMDRLTELAESGAVEFVGEPHFHSLACLYSTDEFHTQVRRHADMIDAAFGQRPRIFANTELVYSNELVDQLGAIDGYAAAVTEGTKALLSGRRPNRVYRAVAGDLRLLVRHGALSDDLAFRFSDPRWDPHPLTAERYAGWIARSIEPDGGDFCGLFLGLDAFGDRHPPESGIFEFLDQLPGAVLAHEGLVFRTLGEAAETARNPEEAADRLDAPQPISWADQEHDLSAWLGNAMQRNAMQELYRLEEPIKAHGDDALLEAWRRLTASDHIYYMATKYDADGAVHRHFSPYLSPYDAYINFMNVLDDLRSRVERKRSIRG